MASDSFFEAQGLQSLGFLFLVELCETMRVKLLIAWGLVLLISAASRADDPRIVVESPTRITVTGLSSDGLNDLNENSLKVSVAAAESNQPMLGTTVIVGDTLVFVPRFPLRAGLIYRIEFEPLSLRTTLSLPLPKNHSATELATIYPSADSLPANQLKFYLHFTAPMSRGRSYQHITLLDENGQPIELPFVEIGEELWDDRQQRLTVLLDPGRIKRGLKPNEEVGPPLVVGRSYTLLISKDWPDAERKPLIKKYRKSFCVGPFDSVQPNPENWQIKSPAANTRAPLEIQLDEPMDHSLLLHCLKVVDKAGIKLAGKAKITQNETVWQFIPDSQWQKGHYGIVVDTKLEDLAGNSIQRPFEVDERAPATRRRVPAQLGMSFNVR